MEINQQGWLEGYDHHPSPHFNERPEGAGIDLIVIHGISLPPGQFGGDAIDHLFCNTLDTTAHASFKALEGVKVSAHVLIRRTGELIQYVSFQSRAWHAGVSSYQGRDNCNDFSIGIELEGTDDQPYEQAQYVTLTGLVNCLIKKYEIDHQCIVGHSDIAPGRKTDPGDFFDWNCFFTPNQV